MGNPGSHFIGSHNMKRKSKPSFDDFYTNHPDYYGKPSDGLISCLREFKLVPGKALDIGCGQGRNAIWLAQNGYVVDAVDTAVNAIAALQDVASSNNLPINAFNGDLCNYSIPINSYDLIVAQTTLNHVEPSHISNICSNLELALNIGGVLYAVCFTEEDPACNSRLHEVSECCEYVQYFFTKDELLNMFKNLHVLRYNEYVKIDTGHGPHHYHGKAKLIAQKRK